jgi:hypothetical protein
MKFQRYALSLFAVLLLASGASGQSTTVPIILTQPWTDTGIFLTRGQAVGIVVSGTMDYWGGPGGCSIPWPGYPGCVVTPAGIPWPGPCSGTLTPGLACVSAVGMVGSATPFEVGIGVGFTAQNDGELFLGVNDGYFADNTGSWTASITAGQGQLQILTDSLPRGQVGQMYNSGALSATGGHPFPSVSYSYSYSWSATKLPPGLDISYFTGEVYGLPATDGSSFPTITVHDFDGTAISKTFVIGVSPAKTRYTAQEKEYFSLLAEDLKKRAEALSIASKGCKALSFLDPFLTPICRVAGGLSTIDSLMSKYYDQKVKDPADMNYTVIAQPMPPSLSFPDPDPSWTAAQLAAFNAMKTVILTEEQISGLSNAEITCINRAEGASEAGNSYWEQQQIAALNRYDELEAFDLQLLLVESQQLRTAYGQSGFPDFEVNVDEATQFEVDVAANGLDPDFEQELIALGVESDELNLLTTAWSSFDPHTISGDILQDFVPPSAIAKALQQLAASFVMQFATFTPTVDITSTTKSFELRAPFILSSNSDGIQPADEDVSVSLGQFAITIPAGGFRVNRNGFYQFTGTVNGVALDAIIKPTTTGYLLQIEGSGVYIGNLTNQMTVVDYFWYEECSDMISGLFIYLE